MIAAPQGVQNPAYKFSPPINTTRKNARFLFALVYIYWFIRFNSTVLNRGLQASKYGVLSYLSYILRLLHHILYCAEKPRGRMRKIIFLSFYSPFCKISALTLAFWCKNIYNNIVGLCRHSENLCKRG